MKKELLIVPLSSLFNCNQAKELEGKI